MRVQDIEVKKRIGESSKFRIYLGERGDQHEEVVLKVAKTFEDGVILSKEAGIFTSLGAFVDEITRLEEGSGAGNTANYGQLLAHLESSFMEPTQSDRMINVFSFPDTTMSELTPMAKLYKSTEIDPRTSVWILGRLFKLYGFYELIKEDGIPSYPHFRADDYLIGPTKHRLIYYNCSEMTADVVAYDFVREITNFIISWLPASMDEKDQIYRDLLHDFSINGRKKCREAHKDLYEVVNDLWGIQYHPFTYRERDTLNWKNIEEE